MSEDNQTEYTYGWGEAFKEIASLSRQLRELQTTIHVHEERVDFADKSLASAVMFLERLGRGESAVNLLKTERNAGARKVLIRIVLLETVAFGRPLLYSPPPDLAAKTEFMRVFDKAYHPQPTNEENPPTAAEVVALAIAYSGNKEEASKWLEQMGRESSK